ncbi:PA14 domain-containing protein [Chryseobacterium viscerum]|uniref:PA14 domain-containing protein n=1 Tax=Chryseobacterium viscerum TaxID=1037377 RepID=A0A5N4BSL7_9FLAO|nr:PA14 domain-containing protein [Chryseobacterium viscerum]KAB1231392.1 hypothetical protein F8D52_06175 [Chryseobacterium viscerum]
MKYKLKYIYSLFIILIGVTANLLYAQYPGGVSSGTTRGYKVDYYNGTFSAETQFGAGTSNAVAGNTGYSNKITGTEFNSIDADYYGMEYTGTLEIITSGNYTFQVAADDRAWLFIDNSLVLSAQVGTTAANVVNLTAGDHTIRFKYYELGGVNSASLQFTAVPAGATGFTLPADIDGRFVRTDNSKLTAWYKASDLAVTANYGGAGIDKVNTWTNKAPDYAGNGNLSYSTSGSGNAQTSVSSLVNFNPGVRFDGDDNFSAGNAQKGLSYRGATKTMFMVTDYASNAAQSGIWMLYHDNGTNNTSKTIGFYKGDQVYTQLAVSGTGASNASAYTANEPKLLGGFVDQITGASAAQATNPLQLNANGSNGTPANILSDVTANSGLVVKGMNTAYFPEAIYYPFKLDATQEKKVNSYLAVKYGITLSHDYLNTSGTPVFSLTTNAGYTNRIFGLGRENNEALYQKQSQSQMASAMGYDFLVVSKDTGITTTNALNNGILSDGSYLLMGDNNGAFTVNPSIATPASFPSTCIVNALTRIWKVQNTGSVTSLSLRAGSSTAGSFVFPGNAANIALWVDTDGDGNFANATVVSAASVANGIATFNGVNLPNGSVFTFGWNVTSPGGVSTGLKLWSKADDVNLATGNVGIWPDLSPGGNNLSRTASSAVIKVDNKYNYNPAVFFRSNEYEYMSSINSLGMNGINKYAEFYVLDGNGGYTSGDQWDEIITLGGGNHRWENSAVGLNNGSYGVYGTGTASSSTGSGTSPTMNNLGLYSNSADGTNAIFRTNGIIRATTATSANLSLSGNFRIGTDVDSNSSDASASNWNSFYSPELIVYNTNLSVTQITQINSYLGIKYSIPLADGTSIDYLASDGTTKPWAANATYKYGVFGIGRDDCSGLNQKQSKAYIDGTDNVAFGLTAIAAAGNAANTDNFLNNKQFVMVANDNGSLTSSNTNLPSSYTALSCNPYRYTRNWLVKNTGTVTNVLQVQVGNSSSLIASNWSNVTLAVNSAGDNTFANGTTTLYPSASVNGGVATFNNVTLPDGAVFTICYTLGFPGGVSKPDAASGVTIAGANYVKGLAYKLYGTGGGATRDFNAAATAPGTGTDTNLSSGYYHNISDDFEGFFSQRRAQNYVITLSGKVLAPRTGTYQFRTSGTDDQLVLKVNNTLIFNQTTATGGNVVSSTTVSLTAGQYYDITLICGAAGTPNNFNLQWDGATAGTFAAIPDANLFVSPQGPSAWYESDDNALSVNTDGTNLSGIVWHDLSGNRNDVTGASGNNPIYYSSTITTTGIAGIRNYNPSIYFTADYFGATPYISGFAYGNTGKSLFTVASNNNNSTETIYTAFGKDNGTGTNFGLSKASNKFQLFTAGNNLNDANVFYNSAIYTTDIISAQLTKAGGGFIYANGLNRLLPGAVLPTLPFNTNFNDNDQLQVGSAADYSGVNYTGNMNEIIYYPWDLSATERQKVNSYLAIKWGTTLDQTTATNYLASDASVIWNATTGGAFKYDITGIGRDDCGALNQKQSTSTDSGDIVSIAQNTFAINNLSNTNTFSADKTFVVFANNGTSFTGISTTNLPPSISGTTCYRRLTHEWQIQTTGTPGTVSMQIGKVGLFAFNASTYKPLLLISSTPGDYSSATIVKYDSIKNGKAYYSNVSFGIGTKYFTIAYISAAPGGVGTNMTVWFNANYDAFTDLAQTNYVGADGDKVASMNNIVLGAAFGNVQQGNSSYQPIYYKSTFNFNPGIYFPNTGSTSMNSSVNINTTDYRTTSTMTSIFAGYNLGTNTDPGPPNVFWYTGNSNADKTSMERNQAFWGSSTAITRTPTLTSPEIYSFASSVPLGSRLYSNLATVGSGTGSGTGNINAPFYIGLNGAAGSGATAGARFYLGEFVIYNDDKGAASSYDMKRIHSYLAVKYGFTLDKASIGGSYIASDGTVIFNDSDYWNRITGIGQDDCAALDQRQSFTQQTTGGLVTISNDPDNGVAISNKNNAAGFTADKSFLLFGDNNKSLTWNGVSSIVYASNNLMKLNRIWRVKETGATANPIGTVFLQVPANTSTATDKLPAPKNSPNDPIYLIVSNAASGGSFNNPTVVPMIPNGADWTVTYDFTDGDYYTFATLESCLAPAGITDGLTSWYKATDMDAVTNGGVIANGTTNVLIDNSGNGNNMDRNTVASSTATVKAGTATLYNYNRYADLAGSAAFVKSGLNASAIFSSNQGSLYTSGNNVNSLFGLVSSSTSSVDRVGINGTGTYAQTGFSNYSTGSEPSIRSLLFNTTASTPTTRLFSREDGTNGARTGTIESGNLTSLAVKSDYILSFGTFTGGTAQPTHKIAEAFTYNRVLTADEQDKLDTYMAIKYGRTLSHNYYSPSYDGTNASATTIYDIIAPYNKRVFGVGNDLGGCLSQNQSTSSNTDSMVKISVDGAILAENSQDKTKWLENRSYVVMGDDGGTLPWVSTSKPKLLARNNCVLRTQRQWKVTATGNNPDLFIIVPGDYNGNINPGAATAKLPSLVSGNSVYMIISDKADFTDPTAVQTEIVMVYNTTSKEWEAAGNTFAAGATRYITFIQRPAVCGKQSIITNRATSTQQLKH